MKPAMGDSTVGNNDVGYAELRCPICGLFKFCDGFDGDEFCKCASSTLPPSSSSPETPPPSSSSSSNTLATTRKLMWNGEKSSSDKLDLESYKKPGKKDAGIRNVNSQLWLYLYCSILSAVLAVVVFVLYKFVWSGSWSMQTNVANVNDATEFQAVLQNFEYSLREIKKNFPRQSKETWRSIMTAVNETTKSRVPKAPGIISLIPSDDETVAKDTVNCLGLELARALHKAYNDSDHLRIDGRKLRSGWPDAEKLGEEFDRRIQRNLKDEANHVVLIANMDQLPATPCGIMLHGFCDNDNAPFKQAIYILTVGSRNKDVKDIVDEEVTFAWKADLTEQKRQSLESRFGNHIALVMPENQETVHQMCPGNS